MIEAPALNAARTASGTRLATVKHERKKIVMNWLCTMCNHAWTTETARPDPARAKLTGAAAGTHKAKKKKTRPMNRAKRLIVQTDLYDAHQRGS